MAALVVMAWVIAATAALELLHVPGEVAAYQVGFWAGVLYMWLTR